MTCQVICRLALGDQAIESKSFAKARARIKRSKKRDKIINSLEKIMLIANSK
jgi:hypothetical protein